MNARLPAPRRRWPGWLVQLAVVVVVLAVAAATFALSYDGVHAIALQAGVPARLARFYPAVLDAVLVIACAAVPALRGAKWWSRCYAWLVTGIVIAVGSAADAVHAMNVTLPHRKTAGVVAVSPWVLLLLAFSLWLSILRHFRAQHAGQPDPADAMGQDFIPTPPDGVAAQEIIPWMTPRHQPRPHLEPAPPAPPAPVAAPPLTAPPPAKTDTEAGGASGTLAFPGQATVPGDQDTPPGTRARPAGGDLADGEGSSRGEAAPLPPDALPPPDVPAAADAAAAESPSPDPEASGPRLRRVRSLPVAPVDDEDTDTDENASEHENQHENPDEE